MSDALPRTLFVGRRADAPAWYRCALPATVLGCDWVGIDGEPGRTVLHTGQVPDTFTMADLDEYDVVVLQQVRGTRWLREILRLREAGVTVLYEIDDWLDGVRKAADHMNAPHIDRDAVRDYQKCMRAADGVICATEWLASRYRAVNPHTWTCRNGLDLVRYGFTLPDRAHVGIGWAGGTGHRDSLKPWVIAARAVMRRHEHTKFISIGEPYAKWLEPEFGDRALPIPFSALEVYPAAMTHFDVALAPAGRTSFFRGKSDLRWLEASALGIPTIGDPVVYPEIEHGVTGFHASTPAEMESILEALVTDPALRRRVGEAARAHVREHRSIQVAAAAWARVLFEARGLRANAEAVATAS